MIIIPRSVIEVIMPRKTIENIGLWNFRNTITKQKSNNKIEGMQK